jgi:hypothetical protein
MKQAVKNNLTSITGKVLERELHHCAYIKSSISSSHAYKDTEQAKVILFYCEK